MRKIALAAAMALSLTASAAYAGPVAGQTGPNNDVLGNGVWGYYGAQVYLVGAGPGGVTALFEFIGKEAGNTNTFFYNDLTNNANDVSFTTAGAGNPGSGYPDPQHSAIASKSVTIYNGLLNFSFTTAPGGGTVTNGSNPLPSSGQVNFFATFNLPGNPTSGTQIWLAMDDQGATDDNHDDMVVRITLRNGGGFSVPDGGATLSLLGGALMGLGLLRRRLSL